MTRKAPIRALTGMIDLCALRLQPPTIVAKLVAELSKLNLGVIIHLRVLLRLRQLPPRCLLSLVVCSPFGFSPVLQSLNNISATLRTE